MDNKKDSISELFSSIKSGAQYHLDFSILNLDDALAKKLMDQLIESQGKNPDAKIQPKDKVVGELSYSLSVHFAALEALRKSVEMWEYADEEGAENDPLYNNIRLFLITGLNAFYCTVRQDFGIVYHKSVGIRINDDKKIVVVTSPSREERDSEINKFVVKDLKSIFAKIVGGEIGNTEFGGKSNLTH